MDAIVAAQAAIRQQAEEQQDSLADLASWMSSIKKKDERLRAAVPVPGPPRQSPRPPPTPPVASVHRGENNSAADHTYDRGYRKWEAFDVDAALQDDDDGTPSPAARRAPAPAAPPAAAPSPVSAASVVPPRAPAAVRVAVPPAVTARESGNAAFRRGDWAGAVDAYSRALSLDPRSAAALSNRAAAHLQARRLLDGGWGGGKRDATVRPRVVWAARPFPHL